MFEKPPTISTKKQDIVAYMKHKNIDIPEKTTKDQLLKAISESPIIKCLIFALIRWQKKVTWCYGLPPYHCDLNPIELVWSQSKHLMRKGNQTPSLRASVVELARQKTNKIDEKSWKNCVRKVKDNKGSFLSAIDFPQIIINLNDSDDDDDIFLDSEDI